MIGGGYNFYSNEKERTSLKRLDKDELNKLREEIDELICYGDIEDRFIHKENIE